MSRLDSFIRRMSAQRACLDAVALAVADMPGCVLELGLGNGRTYDHLRERLPQWDIYVFDQRIAAHPDCIPDQDHLFLGDVLEQLPVAAARLGRSAALIHCDMGSGRSAQDAALAAQLAPLLGAIALPGCLVLSDQAFATSGWSSEALPEGVSPGRYFIYRVSRGRAE